MRKYKDYLIIEDNTGIAPPQCRYSVISDAYEAGDEIYYAATIADAERLIDDLIEDQDD
jgi:hypothetical protein